MSARSTTVVPGTRGRLVEYDSQGLAINGIIVASPANLLSVLVYNASASVRYFQLFNSATVPSDTAVPFMMPIALQPGQSASLTFDGAEEAIDEVLVGSSYTTGISWASSSTDVTKTASGSPDMWVTARYT